MAGSFRVTKEHPKHFEAEGARGAFRIAKSGLSKGRVAKFQALCRGGEVKPKRMAGGGEVGMGDVQAAPSAQPYDPEAMIAAARNEAQPVATAARAVLPMVLPTQGSPGAAALAALTGGRSDAYAAPGIYSPGPTRPDDPRAALRSLGSPEEFARAMPLVALQAAGAGSPYDEGMAPVEYRPAETLTPPHGVKDSAKLAELTESMMDSGWNGRPLLGHERVDGTVQLWTGSHRSAAAKAAGIDVPVVLAPAEALDAARASASWGLRDDRPQDPDTLHYDLADWPEGADLLRAEEDANAQARAARRARTGDPARAPVTDAATSLAEARKRNPKFARGGTVKGQGMDLSNVRLIKDTPEAWHLHDGKAEFRVAKKGVSKALSGQIAQHFAEGGEAQPTGDPGLDMTIAPGTVTPEQAASLPPPVEDAAPDTVESRIEAVPPAEVVGIGATAPPFQSEPGQAGASGLLAALGPAPTGGGMGDVRAAEAAQGAPAAVGVPAMLARPAQDAPGALPGAAAGAATPGAPASVPGAVPGIQKQVADAYAKAEVAAQAQADVAKREAAESLITQQQNEQQRQALTASWQKTWQGWQQRGDELRQQILDQKIDPNHYWKEKGTGGKISAAIGLILGGIGSGLTHQPNAALQVIDNAIGRDIDAQKANLGKTETLLGFHLQEGHSLQASYHLARADMLDASAAKLQMTSTKYAGDKAQATAQGAIAALQKEAAITRQSVAASGLQMQLQGYQLEQAKIGLGMSRLQMGALQAFTSPQATQGQPGAPARAPMGTRIDPRAITYLPKELQEKLVTLPDNSYAVARTPKAAEEVSKTMEGAQVLRDKLARYGALAAKHPHGISSTVDPTDYSTAQGLYSSILTDINGLAGLNRFTETEKGLYSGRVPDLTSKQLRASGHQAKLAELGREIDDKVAAVNKTYLNLAPIPRPGALR